MTWGGWTDEIVALAKRLYIDEGMSGSLVAKKIGAPSRNSVCGKVWRMGWIRSADVTRQNNVRAGRLSGEARRQKTLRAPVVKISPKAVNPLGNHPARAPVVAMRRRSAPMSLTLLSETSLRRLLLQLAPRQCRFSTHYNGQEHLFCAHETEEGEVYCPGHKRVCVIVEAKPQRKAP